MTPPRKIFLRDCIQSRQFFFVYTTNTLSICKIFSLKIPLVLGMFVLNTFKKYGEKNIADDKFLTLVGSVASIFGGIRFVWS